MTILTDKEGKDQQCTHSLTAGERVITCKTICDLCHLEYRPGRGDKHVTMVSMYLWLGFDARDGGGSFSYQTRGSHCPSPAPLGHSGAPPGSQLYLEVL